MRPKQLLANVIRVLVALAITLTVARTANAAARFKVLHAFQCGADGCGSYAGVTLDAAGNIYSAPLGGANNAGIIIKLTRVAGGRRWNYQILHTLTYSEGDGPFAGVTLDSAGNIYGTATAGGTHDSGTVFELTPDGPTPWPANVLYNFCSDGGGYCTDGAGPSDGLVLDKSGNLYGTTREGGAKGGGEAFELTPGSAGWTETVLYSFAAYNGDGFHSWASLIFDPAGNLYGTTEEGGVAGYGTVFELNPGSGGKWNETILHSFNGDDGAGPYAALVSDAAGNLYGAAFHAGAGSCGGLGCGTLFRLTPGSGGAWTFSVLHRFLPGRDGTGHDGANPNGPLVLDKAGNIYGTTQYGGGSGQCPGGCGVVFKLTAGKKGKWKYSVLHRFTGGADGGEPWIGPTIDAKGNLYGTTMFGGTGAGVVFELTPQ